MSRIAIFPFSIGIEKRIEVMDIPKNVKITKFIAIKGTVGGLQEIYIHEQSIPIEYDFEKALENIDEVWIVDDFFNVDIKKNILNGVKKLIENQNKFCWYREEKIPNKFSKYNAAIDNTEIAFKRRENKIFNINTPIIYVIPFIEKIDVINIQSSLYKSFNKVCDVINILPCLYGKLYGSESQPIFMYDKSLSGTDKILTLNNYIKEIEQERKPDLFIIGIPGSIGKYTNNIPGDFGTMLYYYSQALQPDCTILALPYADYGKPDIDNIYKLVNDRFGISVDYFIINDIAIELNLSEMDHRFYFLHLDNRIVSEKKKELHRENIFGNNEVKELFSKVFNQLINYKV